jgi:hypothetical protein
VGVLQYLALSTAIAVLSYEALQLLPTHRLGPWAVVEKSEGRVIRRNLTRRGAQARLNQARQDAKNSDSPFAFLVMAKVEFDWEVVRLGWGGQPRPVGADVARTSPTEDPAAGPWDWDDPFWIDG